MYTSVTIVALTSLLALPGTDGPNWQTDYFAARKQAATAGKPVAVVFGSGQAGHAKVAREGWNAAALKALTDHYVCCYVDVSTPTGQQLAKAFEITRGVGLVLSDRTGKVQAFHTDGDLSVGDLRRCLERFADPNVTVTTTVTDLNASTSLYPPSSTSANGYGYGYGGYGGPGYSGFYGGSPFGQASGYCPTCGGGGRRR
jgi:hypothetical protein